MAQHSLAREQQQSLPPACLPGSRTHTQWTCHIANLTSPMDKPRPISAHSDPSARFHRAEAANHRPAHLPSPCSMLISAHRTHPTQHPAVPLTLCTACSALRTGCTHDNLPCPCPLHNNSFLRAECTLRNTLPAAHFSRSFLSSVCRMLPLAFRAACSAPYAGCTHLNLPCPCLLHSNSFFCAQNAAAHFSRSLLSSACRMRTLSARPAALASAAAKLSPPARAAATARVSSSCAAFRLALARAASALTAAICGQGGMSVTGLGG